MLLRKALCGALLLFNLLCPIAAQRERPASATAFDPAKWLLPVGLATLNTASAASTEGLAAVLDVEGKFAPGESALNKGFVVANGTKFYLNGSPYWCAGTNAYYAGLKWIMSNEEVPVLMQEQAAQGTSVLRVFAHSNFDSVPDPMMPDFGVYNEEAIRRLDLTLVAAAQNGIRCILVLSNFWPFLGGMQEWVDRGIGPGQPQALFYTDGGLRNAYKDWAKQLLTRTNTITGQKYIDDPTILAWELANEPRVSDQFERSNGLPPGKLLCDWVNEMSTYIKSFDANHMVTVGDEGFRTDGSTQEPHSWLNTGYDGVDFVRNLQAPNIDFATMHLYPDSWGIPETSYDWLGPNYIQDRAKIAAQLKKPIILEEYGMRQEGYLDTRDELFSYFHDEVNSLDFACTLVWAVSHYSDEAQRTGGGDLFGSNDGQGYVFGYGPEENGSKSILAQYKYMQNRAKWNMEQTATGSSIYVAF